MEGAVMATNGQSQRTGTYWTLVYAALLTGLYLLVVNWSAIMALCKQVGGF